MKTLRTTLILATLCVPLAYVAATQEEELVNHIKEVTTAQTVEGQIPTFQEVGSTYGAGPQKVPSIVKEALVAFMQDTARGAGPINKEKQPVGFHGTISNTDDIPLGIAMMMVDNETTGAADAFVALSKNSRVPRSIRDRCVGRLREKADDTRLNDIASYLTKQDGVQDKAVGILAYAAMKKPPADGAQKVLEQVKNPTLNIDENIVGLVARADMSEQAVDLSIEIMKAKPSASRALMRAVADADPGALTGHVAELKEIAGKTNDDEAKSAAQRALQKVQGSRP